MSTAVGGFGSNERGRVARIVRDVTPISALPFSISLFPRVTTSIAPVAPILPIGAYVVRAASGIYTDHRDIAVASMAAALMMAIPFTVTR